MWWCSPWTWWTTQCPSSRCPPEICLAGEVEGTILRFSYSLCFVVVAWSNLVLAQGPLVLGLGLKGLGLRAWGQDQISLFCQFQNSSYHTSLIKLFWLRLGAQEGTLSVCLSWYLWILHSIFMILAQIFKISSQLSLSCLSAVSLQSLSSFSHTWSNFQSTE